MRGISSWPCFSKKEKFHCFYKGFTMVTAVEGKCQCQLQKILIQSMATKMCWVKEGLGTPTKHLQSKMSIVDVGYKDLREKWNEIQHSAKNVNYLVGFVIARKKSYKFPSSATVRNWIVCFCRGFNMVKALEGQIALSTPENINSIHGY